MEMGQRVGGIEQVKIHLRTRREYVYSHVK